jgi:hypothetical protein
LLKPGNSGNNMPAKSNDQLIGEIHATVNIMAADMADMKKRIRCLERKWWKSLGAVIGVCTFVSLLGTAVGIYTASKRMEADYLRKDVVPIEVLIEQEGSRARSVAGEYDH